MSNLNRSSVRQLSTLLRFLFVLALPVLLATVGCTAHADPAAEAPPPANIVLKAATFSRTAFFVECPEPSCDRSVRAAAEQSADILPKMMGDFAVPPPRSLRTEREHARREPAGIISFFSGGIQTLSVSFCATRTVAPGGTAPTLSQERAKGSGALLFFGWHVQVHRLDGDAAWSGEAIPDDLARAGQQAG
jgi:hypothetical protein